MFLLTAVGFVWFVQLVQRSQIWVNDLALRNM